MWIKPTQQNPFSCELFSDAGPPLWFPVPPQFSLFWHCLWSWLISPHYSAEPSVLLPKLTHLFSPPLPLTTVSTCIWCLPPTSPPPIAHPVPIFLPTFHSQSCYPAPSSSFLLPLQSPMFLHQVFPLICFACPSFAHSEFESSFSRLPKQWQGCWNWAHSTDWSVVFQSYYLPREQDLKCGALDGVEMPTLV